MSKVVPISPIPGKQNGKPDALARLEKLEDAFITALQDIRAIKSELRKETDEPATLEKFLDAKDVAEHLGESERWVYHQAKAGKIPAIRIGKYWKFSPLALQRWLEQKQIVS